MTYKKGNAIVKWNHFSPQKFIRCRAFTFFIYYLPGWHWQIKINTNTVIKSYTDYKSKPSAKRAAERLAKKLNLKLEWNGRD